MASDEALSITIDNSKSKNFRAQNNLTIAPKSTLKMPKEPEGKTLHHNGSMHLQRDPSVQFQHMNTYIDAPIS